MSVSVIFLTHMNLSSPITVSKTSVVPVERLTLRPVLLITLKHIAATAGQKCTLCFVPQCYGCRHQVLL